METDQVAEPPRNHNVTEDLLETLECPICFQSCLPPLLQCDNGHLICNCCRQNLRTAECPVCRGRMGSTRARVLEQLIEKTEFHCVYRSRGCEELLKLEEKNLHEETCAYEAVPEPFENDEHLLDSDSLEQRKRCDPSASKGVPLHMLFRRRPGKIPVVFLRYVSEKGLPELRPNKFLVGETQPVAYLYSLVRRRLNIRKQDAVFLMIGGTTLVLHSMSLSPLYQTLKAANGILYVTYCTQPTFG